MKKKIIQKEMKKNKSTMQILFLFLLLKAGE